MSNHSCIYELNSCFFKGVGHTVGNGADFLLKWLLGKRGGERKKRLLQWVGLGDEGVRRPRF